jgi:hypothetical protein
LPSISVPKIKERKFGVANAKQRRKKVWSYKCQTAEKESLELQTPNSGKKVWSCKRQTAELQTPNSGVKQRSKIRRH